jgi:glycosyltransferase involved in cell wall biosynthesis
MKVTVSVLGRFHLFYLAQQLQKHNHLDCLISSYPTFEIQKYGIAIEQIRSVWLIEVIGRVWRKVPLWLKGDHDLQLWLKENYDHIAQSYIPANTQLFVGLSSNCLYSLRKAKEMGAITVVERGSSHMACQTQILEEEYERWGKKFTATHPGIYERELQEYGEADKIAIPSFFVKNTFLKQGIPENKLIHVPYGTSLKEFYPIAKEDNKFRVIHCGGINLRKGVQYLLQAFYELNLPDAELWLVGNISSEEIEPFLNKYQSDKIILKGHQPQNRLRWFYSQCSIFCIASIEDGFGMVIPQAMACGLPVIHTTNTGGSDIVRDGIDGFCIPIRNVEAIKDKILFFYENPDKRAEIGQNALLQAQNTLSWDDYGAKIIANYQQIIKKGE